MSERKTPSSFGLAAEFDSPEAVLSAAERIYSAGYRRADAFTPFPVEGLPEALGFHKTAMPMIVGLGGLFGALGGFFMLWYSNVIGYSWNIGGRPPNSWPAFIPITFELGVLFAGLSAVVGMLALNKLPMPYHPVFNIPHFSLASKDKFFIVIESEDLHFDSEKTRAFLQSLRSIEVTEVPR